MSPSQTSDRQPSKRITIPRWLAVILGLLAWFAGIPLVHGLFPWTLSLLTPRFGWTREVPTFWNLLGLVPVAVGTALLLWTWLASLLQVDRVPKRVKLELTPTYLMTRGPYSLTRNPMYVAEFALWLGWTIFYGSGAVFIGFLTLWGLMIFVAVPREERSLQVQFSETYLQYKGAVPRWLGLSGRR